MNNKLFPRRNYLALCFSALLFLALQFTACSTDDDLDSLQQGLLEDGGTSAGDDPDPIVCTGEIYTAGTAAPYVGEGYTFYDAAYVISVPAAAPPEPCRCKDNLYEVIVNQDLDVFEKVAVATGDMGDGVTILYDADPGEPGDSKTQVHTFSMPTEAGNIFLVKFAPGEMISNSAMEYLISYAGGICILDNIQDPTDPNHTDPPTGGGN